MLTIIMEAREAVDATSSQDELRSFATVFQQQASDCIEVHPTHFFVYKRTCISTKLVLTSIGKPVV